MYDHLRPEIAIAFFDLVMDMDPDARPDYIFMTIVAAICFYDPSCQGLENANAVSLERRSFYRILQKLIRSKMRRNDNVSTIADQLHRKVFTRLELIQSLFENSILHIDPGEQIRIISQELESSPAETLYQLPKTSLVPHPLSNDEKPSTSRIAQSRSPGRINPLCMFLFNK